VCTSSTSDGSGSVKSSLQPPSIGDEEMERDFVFVRVFALSIGERDHKSQCDRMAKLEK
jgi:hypothetical protein